MDISSWHLFDIVGISSYVIMAVIFIFFYPQPKLKTIGSGITILRIISHPVSALILGVIIGVNASHSFNPENKITWVRIGAQLLSTGAILYRFNKLSKIKEEE